ncbi:spore germination protein GerPB [Pontibacillus sp. HMF3514]|uniref:spore germination protein GerPB n=1 Tax=Pontibacillus sp. HMF3514 TaxID=2692425 RepID=UPI00131FB2EA|nr:spore germination protein GerPB [Pontibacillus sp. HMF3514]QHE51387.1 spore gernimation protein KA [Pontibacillus sp. HMF3514]
MNYTIHQSICINFLKVGSVSNSSVLQIGSAGVIQARSSLYNTGGYVKPAEEAEAIEKPVTPLVPLSSTT